MQPYATHTDTALIRLVAKGDGQAFTALYNRHWELLFAISYNYCKSKEIAEEVVQDTFLRLWEKRNVLQIDNVGAYLATACKFGVFRQLMKTKRRARLLEQNLPLATDLDEEEAIFARFLAEYLNGTVEQLPPQCRAVYRYSRQQGLSIKEIAEEMELSPKTVESHLNKALKTLRTSLKNMPALLV